MVRGWKAVGATPVRSILIPRPPLLLNAPPVIDTGERVFSPSEAVLLMLVRVRVRFSASRNPVGVLIEIPVAAYRTAESVNWLALPGSRTRPPQSPAPIDEQTPDTLGRT